MNNTAPLLDFVPQAHRFDPTICREYDIRGIVGRTLHGRDAFILGLAFGSYVQKHEGKTVCIGYDGRHSSPDLVRALTDGLLRSGIHVDSVGMGPTPMVYFALKDHLYDACVMVTGSHNPKDYNGFKMSLQSGPIFGEAIQDIAAIAAAGDYIMADKPGVYRELDIRGDYTARLLKDLTAGAAEGLRIAWDAGHGAAAAVLPDLLEQLPGTHYALYNVVDGDFPAHHPDPTVDANLADLRALVHDKKCDVGIAFDGDGDRIGVVDADGRILRCDTLLGLYAADVLDAHPGAPIIGDIKCSGTLFQEIERLGGEAVIWKTGHSLIKDKMAELRAPLAGELSGHIFFNDRYYGFDDALYCAIRLINIIGEAEEGGLATLTAHIPQLKNTPELRIDVPEEEKFTIADQIREAVMGHPDLAPYISDIDGVRYDKDGNWWLIRPSNTQNAFVIRLEATTEEGLAALQQDLLSVLKPFKLNDLLIRELEKS